MEVTLKSVILFFILGIAYGFTSERMLLTEINVITLYHSKMTRSGRTSPIPQLKCIGGSAGCSRFTPQVVQCYNRGTDGYDVQWECKTDMDNSYRFGKVEVSCEGYEYPDDPYVLKGSCGMEYTLDLTEEGHRSSNNGNHDYYGGSSKQSAYTPLKTKSSGFGDLVMLVIVGVVIYAIYRTCIANAGPQAGEGDEDTPSSGNTGGRGYSNRPPPAAGFRDEYSQGGCSGSYGNSYNTGSRYNRGNTGGFGGGNFWSGAATGGILGYMFGNRNSGYQQQPYGRSTWGGVHRPAFGGGFSSGSSWGGGGSSFGGSGTRTASGFATTKRR